MADITGTRPLTRESVEAAHELIREHIHLTPVMTSRTLSKLASTPQSPEALIGTPFEGQRPARPKINLFFKCENFQRIGAFKIRGAFHALCRLSKEELSRGVVTASSGNHAQALALAARTFGTQAHIVMPTISTPSKIAATKGYGATVYFSGSTSQEREAVVQAVIKDTGATHIPAYDHPNIILGQGTLALEFSAQVSDMNTADPTLSVHRPPAHDSPPAQKHHMDSIISPLGGGGLLSGLALALHPTPTRLYGAEPSFQDADDGRRSLLSGSQITHVSSLTIADGLRTPVGEIPWTIISNQEYVRGVFSVTEGMISEAMKLVMERCKLVVEPSAAVGVAVALWDEGFRRIVEEEGGEEGWDVGVVLSGGNVGVEALGNLFPKGSEA